jgi:hypothetical protein
MTPLYQYLKEKRTSLTVAAESGDLAEFLRLAEMAAHGLLVYFEPLPNKGAITIGIGCDDTDNEIQVLCATGPTSPTSLFLASTQAHAWRFNLEEGKVLIENSNMEEPVSVEEFLCELGGAMCEMASALIFCADPMSD